MKKNPKKYGIFITLRDYKESFSDVQKSVNEILKLHPDFIIFDGTFNPGDDNTWTVLTNYPQADKDKEFEKFMDNSFLDLSHYIIGDESDDNCVVWFDSLEDLEELKKQIDIRVQQEELDDTKDFEDLEKAGKGVKKRKGEIRDTLMNEDADLAQMVKDKILPQRTYSYDSAATYLALKEAGLRK